jgi:uncharacterized protein
MTEALVTVEAPVTPVHEFVLKIASRCDLACDHCYVYADPDRGWLKQPRFMSEPVVRAAAARISAHARDHGLPRLTVILHGGEPLLAGPLRLRRLLETLRAQIDPVCDLSLQLQTNGLGLTQELCDLLAEYHVQVGVSLDGDQVANDRHRRYLDGRGSYAQVLAALALLRRAPNRALYSGLLCTVDVANDPVAVYEALLEQEPPRLDFLLPHATWDAPPPRPGDAPAPYADWLLAIFDRWIAGGQPVPIRGFDSLLALAAGRPSSTEALGGPVGGIAVVETAGTWEQVDSLRIISPEAPWTGLNVHEHTVDDVAGHDRVVARLHGELAPECLACPVLDSCGGGLFAHRFGRGNGFRNPSVFCADLFGLVTGIRSRRAAAATVVPAGAGPRPAPRQLLADDQVRDLAAGRPAALTALARLEHELDRAMLERMVAAVAPVADAAWALLTELITVAPGPAGEVLAHPFLRSRLRALWAAPEPAAGPALSALVGALAIAIAGRAGRAAEVTVPGPADGVLLLPGLGALTGSGQRSLTIRVDEDGRLAEPAPGAWTPSRWVTDGPRWLVEDLDPHRDCFPVPVAPRPVTDPAPMTGLRAARHWLADTAPRLLTTLDLLVHSLVPVRPAPHRGAVVATSRGAFGALAVAEPLARTPAAGAGAGRPESEFGRRLAHASMRIVLAAVQDGCDLVMPEDGRIGPVPTDPGPAPVAELQRLALRVVDAELAAPAGPEAGRPRHELDVLRRELDVLRRGPGWTGSGQAFLTGLRVRIESRV